MDLPSRRFLYCLSGSPSTNSFIVTRARAQHKSSVFLILIIQFFFLCIKSKGNLFGFLEARPLPPFFRVGNKRESCIEPNRWIRILSTVHFTGE